MGGLSITHLLVVLIIALLLFGAGRVSEIGKGLGEGIRNFKKGLKDEEEAAPQLKRRALSADEDEIEAPRLVAAKKRVVEVEDDDAPGIVAAPKKKKKIIQIEVDDDEDEEEVLRRVAKSKASEGEKTT